jgi:hypothetical protein
MALALLAIVAIVLVAACGTSPASPRERRSGTVTQEGGTAADQRISAALTTRGLAGFDQLNVNRRSSLRLDRTRRYRGNATAKATIAPDPGGANTFARGLFRVRWHEGVEVRYGAAFYLPVGFKAAMQGEVDLVRWDNFPSEGWDDDFGGLVLFDGDKQLHLTVGTPDGYRSILGPYQISEGRWHVIGVRQRLGGPRPFTRLAMDGRLLGHTMAPNAGRFPIDRVRFGLVAIGGDQTNGLTLWLSDALAAAHR